MKEHIISGTYAHLKFHHMGIPTTDVQPFERYSARFKMFTADHEGDFKIQFHRFESGSPLHPLIKTLPHVAFQVDNLEEAIKNKRVILGPYEPFKNYRVAMINDDGIPVELIETNLTDEELWADAREQKDLNTKALGI